MRKRTYKRISKKSAFLLAVIVFLNLVMGTSVVEAASYNGANYSSDYTTWKQSDSAWGSKRLGDLCTMSDSGCLITSIAILMAKSGAENPNNFCPGTLRDRYESKGYVSHHSSDKAQDGNLYAAAYTQANQPNFYQVDTSNFHPTPYAQIYETIKSKLDAGYYAVVNVNYGGHFVAVASCSNGEVYIHDPANSGKTTLKAYDGGIEGAIYFASNKPKDTKAPTIEDFKITNLSSTGYTVHCIVRDDSALASATLYTWTPWIDGQDDLTSDTALIAGGSWELNFGVKISDHKNNQNCEYVSDIYVYDAAGNCTSDRISVYVGKTENGTSDTITQSKTPVKISLKSVSAKSKGFTANWSSIESVAGYQIQYATNAFFTSAKTVTVSGGNSSSKAVTGLKAKKKYYVRIRSYVTSDGKKKYSSWSSSKKVTTKK